MISFKLLISDFNSLILLILSLFSFVTVLIFLSYSSFLEISSFFNSSIILLSSSFFTFNRYSLFFICSSITATSSMCCWSFSLKDVICIRYWLFSLFNLLISIIYVSISFFFLIISSLYSFIFLFNISSFFLFVISNSFCINFNLLSKSFPTIFLSFLIFSISSSN